MRILVELIQIVSVMVAGGSIPWLLGQASAPSATLSTELLPINFKEVGAFAVMAGLSLLVIKSLPFLVVRSLSTIDNTTATIEKLVKEFREESKACRAEFSQEREMARAHFERMLESQNAAYLENKKVLAGSFDHAINEMRTDTGKLESAINRLCDAVASKPTAHK